MAPEKDAAQIVMKAVGLMDSNVVFLKFECNMLYFT